MSWLLKYVTYGEIYGEIYDTCSNQTNLGIGFKAQKFFNPSVQIP